MSIMKYLLFEDHKWFIQDLINLSVNLTLSNIKSKPRDALRFSLYEVTVYDNKNICYITCILTEFDIMRDSLTPSKISYN